MLFFVDFWVRRVIKITYFSDFPSISIVSFATYWVWGFRNKRKYVIFITRHKIVIEVTVRIKKEVAVNCEKLQLDRFK